MTCRVCSTFLLFFCGSKGSFLNNIFKIFNASLVITEMLTPLYKSIIFKTYSPDII